jgi:hypothetical protein
VNRLTLDVSKWVLWMHRNIRGLELASADDPARMQLEDEIFQRLLDDKDPLPVDQRHPQWGDWATRIHEACSRMPDFERLAAECHGDADAAGVALDELLQHLEMDLGNEPPDDARLRKGIRIGTARASSMVDELRDAALGLEHVQIMTGGTARTGRSATEGHTNVGLARRLREDQRLRRIATLAGRFVRILGTKRRSRVRPGVDEISDVGLGGDLHRLLPAALVRIIHPKLHLLGLAELAERRAMSYELAGLESMGKGPAVVLIDRSDSMNEEGRDEWSIAVALALLSMAKADGRTFALVPFNGAVLGEFVVGPHDLLPAAALAIRPSGGTDVSAAVERALGIIGAGDRKLGNADVVLVSDGASDPTRAPALKQRASDLGATVFGVAIQVRAADLLPWCDLVEEVRDVVSLPDGLASSLAREVA